MIVREKGYDVIYVPGGRAFEYNRLALNIYKGCEHGCRYCYVPGTLRMTREAFHSEVVPRKNILQRVKESAKQMAGDEREILLCFTSDPYPKSGCDSKVTRDIINELIKNELSFTILTKAGANSQYDFDLLEKYPKARYGATISHLDERIAKEWEPDAAPIWSRIMALEYAHARGIPTWVSVEPVINPESALEVIKEIASFTDQFKVGKWNHDKRANEIDWKKFGFDAKELLESLNKPFILKHDLKEEMGI